MTWFVFLALGLALGSFLNVCIHRIPRRESIVNPPSHCPHCKRPIRYYDNIPVLSYLILGGRCRDCRRRISPRYVAVEALTAALCLAVYARFGLSWATVQGLAFVCLLIVIAAIDLEHQVIPFRLSVSGLLLALAWSLLPPLRLRDALLGAVIGAAFVAAAWALWRYLLAGAFRRFGVEQREGMGGGDLPFAAMIGGFLGARSLAVALFAAVGVGVIVGVVLRVSGKTQRGQPVPFGPFLALGGLLGLFFGPLVWDWYLSQVLAL